MRCPICGNLRSSGRCPHSLYTSSKANTMEDRITTNNLRGRIGISDATKQLKAVHQGKWG